MPAIITDTFDYDDIVRVLDLDEAFVHHQIDALQPKYWRIVIKTKPKGLKIFAPVIVSGNRGIDYMIYMLSRDWQITKKQRLLTITKDIKHSINRDIHIFAHQCCLDRVHP